jgi:hypothetical protein
MYACVIHIHMAVWFCVMCTRGVCAVFTYICIDSYLHLHTCTHTHTHTHTLRDTIEAFKRDKIYHSIFSQELQFGRFMCVV